MNVERWMSNVLHFIDGWLELSGQALKRAVLNFNYKFRTDRNYFIMFKWVA